MIVNNLIRKGNEIDLELVGKSKKTVSWSLSDSFHLRLLIHYVGDVHQPLHASSRYTKKYPEGDEGGNLFYLSSE